MALIAALTLLVGVSRNQQRARNLGTGSA
jgi:hypothetical protein